MTLWICVDVIWETYILRRIVETLRACGMEGKAQPLPESSNFYILN